MRANGDRVDTVPGAAGVGLFAEDPDAQVIGAGQGWARAVGDLPGRHTGPHMQAKYRIGLGRFHHAFLHHHLRTPGVLAVGDKVAGAFFGRLEIKHHGAGQALAHPGENLRSAQQDSGMGVVAAGVHHVDFFAQVGALGFGGEGQVGHFLDRQRIHVCAQGHGRAGQGAFQDGDDASAGHPGLHLKAEFAQLFGDQLGGAGFGIAQFRMGVDIAAGFQQAGFEDFCLGGNGFPGTVLAAAGGDHCTARDRAEQTQNPLVCQTVHSHTNLSLLIVVDLSPARCRQSAPARSSAVSPGPAQLHPGAA